MAEEIKRKHSRAHLANIIEGWASGAYAAGKMPDVLSATEIVAENWQEIVAALRIPTRVTLPMVERAHFAYWKAMTGKTNIMLDGDSEVGLRAALKAAFLRTLPRSGEGAK